MMLRREETKKSLHHILDICGDRLGNYRCATFYEFKHYQRVKIQGNVQNVDGKWICRGCNALA